VQLASLAATAAWLFLDPLFLSMVNTIRSSQDWSSLKIDPIRGLFAMTLPLASLISLLWILYSLLRSNGARGRTIKSLLAVTTVIGLWCGLVVQHKSLAWQGKRVRVAMQLDQFRLLSESLQDNFPTVDGELSSVGPFMAYPHGRPRVLILLTPPALSQTGTTVSAIEKLDNGFAFQLSGIDGGDWVQWHPQTQPPTSFGGGLGDSHRLQSSTVLAENWYLVRYETSDL